MKALNKVSVVPFLKPSNQQLLVPYNLWFNHSQFRIECYDQNDQKLRLRYFNQIPLTPLAPFIDQSIKEISQMSLYEPFYPETFYDMWEMLHQCFSLTNVQQFLTLTTEIGYGFLEALMMYNGRHQTAHSAIIYHSWLSTATDRDHFSYRTQLPVIDYLKQVYPVIHLTKSQQFLNYQWIGIYSWNLAPSLADDSEAELNIQSTTTHLCMGLKCLQLGGTMVVKLSFTDHLSMKTLFQLVEPLFAHYQFYRPSMLHCYNPTVYLVLTNYVHRLLPNVYPILLESLYVAKAYKVLTMPVNEDKSAMYDQFKKIMVCWVNAIKTKTAPVYTLQQWHCRYHLKQVGNVYPQFNHHFVDCFFNKRFADNLIDATRMLYPLQRNKQQLFYCKKVMDTKPSNAFSSNPSKNAYLTWESLFHQIDVYQNLKSRLRSYNAQIVTNAWMKMYEILNKHPKLIPYKTVVKSFHLCEAPGAFISAIHHYLTNRQIKLDWYAQTLVPNANNGALADHYQLIKKYPNRWLFGDQTDNSGDITHCYLHRYYANHPHLQNIDLITADAGIYTPPNQLEMVESNLIKVTLGQVACILACLRQGGSAILKVFLPMAEPLTISLVYLLYQHFKEVYFSKPTTSHCTNSEVYLVLIHYTHKCSKTINQLSQLLTDPLLASKQSLFDQYPFHFSAQYLKHVRYLINRQISALHQSYYYYYHPTTIKQLAPIITNHTNQWLHAHRIATLTHLL